MNALLLTR